MCLCTTQVMDPWMLLVRIEGLVRVRPLALLLCLDGFSSHSCAGVRVIIRVSMAERPAQEPKWSGEMAPVSFPTHVIPSVQIFSNVLLREE